MTIPDELPREYLEHHLVLPLAIEDGTLKLAAAGEPPSYVFEDLITLFGVPVTLVVSDRESLLETIRRLRPDAEAIEVLHDDSPIVESDASGSENTADIRDMANKAPVIRFVSVLLRDAADARASDIHLDATRAGLSLRFRVDGVLADVPPPARPLQDGVLTKLKLMAGMDIAQRRIPQDGRIRIRLEDRELDLRAATAPNHFGESMALRLLDRGGRPVQLAELGMPEDLLEHFRALCQRPHGIVLASGPTGSGKTTTLYAALALRDRNREKVVTVEDPVEYELEGVTQIPVAEKAGLTFGRALKALVRLDPDVLMIGEIRDQESADIATRSAMTGHLVFSTLHTNDAVSAMPRLTDLGVPAYMVAATVEAVLAQRLVRRSCPDCRQRYRPEPDVVALLAGRPIGRIQLERGQGCAACRGTGYRGRTGIYELLCMNEQIKLELSRGADARRIRELAAEQGMRTLKQDGWAKVEAGITTVEEVLRVVH